MANLTKAEAASKLGCSEKALASWLRALGTFVQCSRCHGSGEYSFNTVDGSRCYGCMGRGIMMPKLTAKLIDAAKVRVDAGEMVPHIEAWRAQNAAKRSIAALVAEGKQIYQSIGDDYSVLSCDSDTMCRVTVAQLEATPVYNAQMLNNALFYNRKGAFMSLSEIEAQVDSASIDYVQAARVARRNVAALRGLRMAWNAFKAQQA